MLFKIDSEACDLESVREDARHFYQRGSALLTAPLNFDGKDWCGVGLILAGTALLFSIDKPVREMALNNQTSFNDRLLSVDQIHGNEYDLYLAGAIYGFGLISKKENIRRIGLHAVEAYLFSGAITGIGKILFGRRRPYAGESHLFFLPCQTFKSRYQSLPSGHTTVSFAVSTVIAKSWDNIVWKLFWYGNAGLVAAARIYHNKHWFSDTFLGAIVGYSVANFIVNSDHEKGPTSKTAIVPRFTNESIGIDFCFYLNWPE